MGCIFDKPFRSRHSSPPARGSRRHKGGTAGLEKQDLCSSTKHVSDDEVEERDVENGDRPTPLYSALDADAGVPRLSRLSGQFLPPSGSRVARLPNFSFELHYSYLSQRGYYPEALDKANQDSFCIHTQFGKDLNDHFFGVFDGHGEYGTQCSQFVKKHLCENLLKDRHFRTDVVHAYHSAFAATNSQLHRHNIDDSMSGTTAITVLVRGRTLYVANVGDSRAVLAEKRGKDLVAIELSSDQTPFRSDECARVKLCGARVLTLDQLEGLKNPNVQCWGGEDDDDGDPPRLWVPNGMYPGTAFTRSIGDKIAEQIGVIAVPEVLVMELSSKNPFFVIASDGVFEFLSSQQVVNMVAEHPNPCNSCAAVVAEAYRLWLHYETRTDDITIIVVCIEGLVDDQVLDALGKTFEPVELSEQSGFSPAHIDHTSMERRPVRHEVSGSRLRAIESSLHGGVRESALKMHPKSDAELVRIERALQGNFLFNGLTDMQRHDLYNCMEKVYIKAGDVIIKQGAEDDCFYIVESGEFDVLVSQVDSGSQDLGTVVNRYTAEAFSCFGELALIYSKPRQSSVRALTDGSLWSLKREVFWSVLSAKYSHESIVKTLKNIDILSHLTLVQLCHLSESMTECFYKKGERLISKDDSVSSFYLVHHGEVQLITHLNSVNRVDGGGVVDEDQVEIVREGDCFGEWVLLEEFPRKVTAIALSDVECWVITKVKFESVVGQLMDIMLDDIKNREWLNNLRNKYAPQIDFRDFEGVKLSDLEWQRTVYSTDCCDIGLAVKKGSNNILVSLKRYSKRKVKLLGRHAHVLQEKTLIQSLRPSIFVPQVIATCADRIYAAIVLNTCLVGPLSLVLCAPLDENSAQFIAASAVLALDLLHKDGVVYRGISPDILMLDDKGRLQLADFRFAKKMSNERTYTICGMADFLAPEIIKGQGHGFAADWWAVGVLIYFMLQNELPFGSWRDSELDIFARVARRQLTIPENFSPEVNDLLNKLLVVEEEDRLGSGQRGALSIQEHAWFGGFDWEDMLECRIEVPSEILARLEVAIGPHHIDDARANGGELDDISNLEDVNTPFWLDDW